LEYYRHETPLTQDPRVAGGNLYPLPEWAIE